VGTGEVKGQRESPFVALGGALLYKAGTGMVDGRLDMGCGDALSYLTLHSNVSGFKKEILDNPS